MSTDLPEKKRSNLPELSRLALHRLSRGAALTCLILLSLFPIALLVLRFVNPHSDHLQFVLFWVWLFISPLLAGAGLLLTMLAMVVVNAKHRAAAILMGMLTTAFLILMSQVL
jgi:hypothetical protein